MSLDVYLTMPCDGANSAYPRDAIFIREGGQKKEISRDEWNRRYPGREPVTVEKDQGNCVFEANITHNLNVMAKEAGIYQHLWHPDELGITKARQLIAPLANGLALMTSDPERFIAFNPDNGWGSYDIFVPWIASYLNACCTYPNADVSTWG